MPKKPFDPKKTWLCEECGAAQDEAVNPPDSCKWCGYKFFDCLADVLKAREQSNIEA